MNTQKKGKLYLIPTPLAENSLDNSVTPELVGVMVRVKYYLVENIRTARRFISSLKQNINIEDLHFEVLDKHNTQVDVHQLCAPLLDGVDMGVMSEAGCPGIADPGNLAVSFAHLYDIRVIPLVGPSSIFMALMASGFNGQSFVFHGYLPIDSQKRALTLKAMERDAYKKQQTQIFMETPYRNNQLLDDIIKVCQSNTMLCIAKDVSGSREMIKTKNIMGWEKARIDLHKVPTIFLIYPK